MYFKAVEDLNGFVQTIHAVSGTRIDGVPGGTIVLESDNAAVTLIRSNNAGGGDWLIF